MSMETLHAVVTAVAADTGQSELELPPLHDVIDPDVVESFVQSTNGEGALQFEYCDRLVTIDANGDVATDAVSTRRAT